MSSVKERFVMCDKQYFKKSKNCCTKTVCTSVGSTNVKALRQELVASCSLETSSFCLFFKVVI
jgi:hypothetical protein